jgi:hypothetical protein
MNAPSVLHTVVLISGQMRTADQCAAGIREIYPDATFVVHAVADDDAEKAFLFRPAATVIEPQYEMPERREYSWQMGRGCHGAQRVLKQLWGLRRVWQVFEASGIEADCIVRCRPDLVFGVRPEPFAGTGWRVPKFANWYGFNDRFAFGDLPSMRRYFTRLDRLDEYIDQGGIFHPETFLGWAMRGVPAQSTRAVFATLRADGTRDEPVWFEPAGDIR